MGVKPSFSGRGNALLSAMLQGSTKCQAKKSLEEIKGFSELGDSFEESVRTYSAGMKSPLGFVIALMTHVDILLVDEVLSVGNARFKLKAEGAMKTRIGGDQTVVLVTHNNKQIRDLCHRAIWIEGGRIASEGDTESVLQDYNRSIYKSN
jgi:lipopolysaccharide transport system ATP-binding protein